MTSNDNIFMKITNKDIYLEIKKYQEANTTQHNQIIERLDKTNGKVKLSKWIATTALALALIAIGYLFSHISTYHTFGK